MAVRVTRTTGEIVLSDRVRARITRVQGQTLFDDRTNPVRVTRVQAQTVFNDRTNPVRVTRFAAQVLGSLLEAPELIPPRAEIALIREANPYRPVLPTEVEDVSRPLFDFMAEHTEIQREQHNVTQAGDSTFPWELLTKWGSERQFTLGSLGRFYHDDYGIILARYCRFTKLAKATWVNGPVGLLRSDDVVSWRVTNDPKISSPELLVGILAAYEQPDDDSYGWVVTQGANPVPLLLPEKKAIAKGVDLTWNGFETVDIDSPGVIVGRTRSKNVEVNQFQNQMPIGTVYLKCEGPSIESLRAMLGASFTAIEDQVAKIQAAIDALDPENLLDGLNGLSEALDNVDDRLKTIETDSLPQIADLRRRVTKLENQDWINTLYLKITGEWQLVTDALKARIEEVARSIPAPASPEDLQALIKLAADANRNAQRKLIPMVTGEIPPVLVYLPTGELVFLEITI